MPPARIQVQVEAQLTDDCDELELEPRIRWHSCFSIWHRTRTRTRTADQTATYTMLGLWFESLLSPAWNCLGELQQFSN